MGMALMGPLIAPRRTSELPNLAQEERVRMATPMIRTLLCVTAMQSHYTPSTYHQAKKRSAKASKLFSELTDGCTYGAMNISYLTKFDEEYGKLFAVDYYLY